VATVGGRFGSRLNGRHCALPGQLPKFDTVAVLAVNTAVRRLICNRRAIGEESGGSVTRREQDPGARQQLPAAG
jgi:hypothetical protein